MCLSNNVKEIYSKISTDNTILERYKEVEKYEELNGGWAYHNIEHIKNVTSLVDKILRGLKYNEDLIYKAKIASFLHDTGVNKGKDNHAIRSYEFAKEYFKENNINFSGTDLVLEAIKIHSDGFETDNIIALALILADKLDIKKSRISEEGKKVKGNRQYGHIEDISLEIDNDLLKIDFITDGDMDIKELNDYYFTKKVFKAIQRFAEKLKINYLVLMDGKVYQDIM